MYFLFAQISMALVSRNQAYVQIPKLCFRNKKVLIISTQVSKFDIQTKELIVRLAISKKKYHFKLGVKQTSRKYEKHIKSLYN